MRICLLLLALLLAWPGCVYFNTYYNAQKFFRQAEKARKDQEEEQALLSGGARKRKGRETTKASELYDKAARTASRVIEEYQESKLVDDAMFLMGRAFYWQGDYASAIRTFAELEQYFPNSEFCDRSRYWQGLAYEAQGAKFEARERYRALFSAGRGREAVQAGQRLGEMAFLEGDYVAAAQEYRAALEAFPQAEERAELWLRLGEAIMARQDTAAYGEALDAFARVRQERPAPEAAYRARLNQGRILYSRGQVDEALQVYTSLLKEQRFRPFEGQTRLLIGQHYQARRLLDQALAQYEKVRDDFPQTPSSAMALYYTGMLYFRDRGDQERAREYLQEVAKEKPGSEAAELSGERLKDLAELDRVMERIHRADSLATAADSARLAVPPDSAQGSLVQSDPDSAEGAGPDSTGADEALVDSAQAEAIPAAAAPVPAQPDSARWADLFAAAEIYRDKLVQPDSAAHYYQQIIDRFPTAPQLPRALYSLAWVCREMKSDRRAAVPSLERLVAEYPGSEHANAARQWLGLEVQRTVEEQAAAEFTRIEEQWVKDRQAPETYVPLLDSLSRRYPDTRTAARAAYLAAWAYENIRGDSAAAEARYERLLQEHPRSDFARLVEERRRAQEAGAIDKLARGLKALARGLQAGERLEVIAVEPDSTDSLSLARKYLGFGLRAHRRGELQAARHHYEMALEQQERLPEALYRLGRLMYQEGYFEDAGDYYRQLLRWEPGSIRACYGLLGVHLAASEEDSANFYVRELVKRDRRNPQVEALLERFPTLASAEPEALDQRSLESLELAPEEDWGAAPQGLSALPLVRESAAPVYPRGAAADSAEVVLDVLVGKDGKPEQVEVFKGEPPFSEAAVEAARQYTFFPGVGTNDEEVRVWVELVMRFAPPAAAVASRPAADSAAAPPPAPPGGAGPE